MSTSFAHVREDAHVATVRESYLWRALSVRSASVRLNGSSHVCLFPKCDSSWQSFSPSQGVPDYCSGLRLPHPGQELHPTLIGASHHRCHTVLVDLGPTESHLTMQSATQCQESSLDVFTSTVSSQTNQVIKLTNSLAIRMSPTTSPLSPSLLYDIWTNRTDILFESRYALKISI